MDKIPGRVRERVGSRLVAAGAARTRVLPPFRGKVMALRHLARLLVGPGTDVRIPIRLTDGSQLALDPRSRTEAGALFDGKYDEDDLAFFSCCLSFGGVAIDIGANVGLITIPLARMVGPEGFVHAFEPVKANVLALRANIMRNDYQDNVVVHECALGAQRGSLRIGRETGSGAATGNAYLEQSTPTVRGALKWSSVAMESLDESLHNQVDRIDFIKIDVEGAEYDVLLGAMETIGAFRPIIYGEFQLSLRPGGPTMVDVGRLFAGRDYTLLAFRSRLETVEVQFEAGRGNVALVPNELVEQVREKCQDGLLGTQPDAGGGTKGSI